MFKSILAAILLAAAFVSVSAHAVVNNSKVKDVYFTKDGYQHRLHCKNCFSDLTQPNDVAFTAAYTSKFFVAPSEIIETKNYALVKDAWDKCDYGRWVLIDKRAPFKEAVSRVKIDFCNMIHHVTLNEGWFGGLEAEFVFSRKDIKPQVVKLR